MRVGPQARDHHQPLAAVATGQLGKGQHIVKVDPAKGLGGAGLLAGGAKAAEGEFHRFGQIHLGQHIEIDRQPVAGGLRLSGPTAEQGQFMLRGQLPHQLAADEASGSGDQDPAHAALPV